jgi:hypothetical protein
MSREAWIALAVFGALVVILTIYGAVKLVRKVFATRRRLGELGPGGKFAFYGSLFYTFFPLDILPDPIYLDDMTVLGGALLYLTKLLNDRGRLPSFAGRLVGPDARRAPTLGVHGSKS